VFQGVEQVPNKDEAVSSNPNTAKKIKYHEKKFVLIKVDSRMILPETGENNNRQGRMGKSL
jgi:hypothetical protein